MAGELVKDPSMTKQENDENREDEFGQATDPFLLFDRWYGEAKQSEMNDPNAMALATADPDGLPNVRMVLLKGLDHGGFVFYTNEESQKGEELAANPKASMVFHWKSLRRQVRVRGEVEAVSGEESDAYFASRPRLSQIGAWASQQSRPIAGRFELEAAIAKASAKYVIGAIPRPSYWHGYRVLPTYIEFWRDRPFRLHDRAVFRRDGLTSPWSVTRLFP